MTTDVVSKKTLFTEDKPPQFVGTETIPQENSFQNQIHSQEVQDKQYLIQTLSAAGGVSETSEINRKMENLMQEQQNLQEEHHKYMKRNNDREKFISFNDSMRLNHMA